jgi:4-amino-4-deoxy-L-arabinose transferase-like glycosyltransferase
MKLEALPWSRRSELSLVVVLLLIAAGLRLYQLSDIPPGWRDDEVVETAVHAQWVLDGRWPLYFPQAEGHEPLYHYLSAGLIALAGRSLFSVRLLSVFFGLLSLAALYRLARRLVGPGAALIATAALSVSFWSLMYARFRLRHISEVGFMLLAFYFFLRPLTKSDVGNPESGKLEFGRGTASFGLYAGIGLAACLYTYFAARAVPLVLLAFVVYLLLFQREVLRTHWPGFALTLVVAAVLAAPLAWAIVSTPGGEARLSIVGRPLLDLLHGDFAYALDNTRVTLGMFAFTGDPEYLYNIPHRPVFEPLGASLFLAGALICLWRWRQPRFAFLLLWLVGGLAPAFVSTPAASLGHTIAAQPVMYLLPAIAVSSAHSFLHRMVAAPRTPGGRVSAWWRWLVPASAGLFLSVTAIRDVYDYFVRWPALPEVRYLYRADLHAGAAWLNAQPPASPDLALSSRDLHQADAQALQLETPMLHLRPRLFNPARAWLFPNRPVSVLMRATAPAEGEFGQAPLEAAFAIRTTGYVRGIFPETALTASFANGLTCFGYTLRRDPTPLTLRLYTFWRADAAFTPPLPRPIEVLAGTPIPLKIFSHLLDPEGAYLLGDDRLDVDPATLRPDDDFIQLLILPLPEDLPPGEYPLEIGLYNPADGERVRLISGEDHLTLTPLTLPTGGPP